MQKMGMPSCLVVTAHHSERHDGVPVLAQHARNDRVHRPLSRRDRIRMTGNKAEPSAPVVQQHASPRHDNAGSEERKERVDERYGVAVAVDDAEVSCVLMLGSAPIGGCPNPVEPDLMTYLFDPGIREEP